MPYKERPTIETMNRLKDRLTEVWADSHSEWREIDSFVEGSFEIWPMELQRPVYHPPKARAIIDHAVDNQMAHAPKVHRYPAGEGEAHEARADKVEPYVMAVFEEAALLEPTLTWKQAARYLVQYGYMVVNAPVLDTSRRPEEPQMDEDMDEEDREHQQALYDNAKKTWMPFRTRVPHPSTVLLDPNDKQPQLAIVQRQWFAHELQELTQQRKRRGRRVDIWQVDKDPYELVPGSEMWTPYWHAVMANRGDHTGDPQMLFVEKNTWGYLPYNHAFSSWGSQVTRADGHYMDPKYLAKGLLYKQVRETLKMVAQAMAGRHNALIEATFMARGTTMEPSEVAQQLSRADIVNLPDKGALWPLEMPNLPAWLLEALNWLDQELEFSTFSRAVAGIREPGVQTVGELAIRATAAVRKFVGPTRQMEHLATIVASNILRLVDLLGETLYCQGHTINPRDIEHDYSILVQFDLVDPVLQLQERSLAMQEVQAGLKSKESYWSVARVEDVTGERKRLLMDAVRADPQVHALLAAEVAREQGLLELLEARLTAGNGKAANGALPPTSGLLGPDGMPILGGSMGQPSITPPELRQPLTPNTAKPGQANPLAFAEGRI